MSFFRHCCAIACDLPTCYSYHRTAAAASEELLLLFGFSFNFFRSWSYSIYVVVLLCFVCPISVEGTTHFSSFLFARYYFFRFFEHLNHVDNTNSPWPALTWGGPRTFTRTSNGLTEAT